MDIRLRAVAIRFVKFVDDGHDWAVFEIGRLGDCEREELEKAFDGLADKVLDGSSDPTKGKLQYKTGKSDDVLFPGTYRVCLYVQNMDSDTLSYEDTYDAADVRIEYHDGNVRPCLKSITQGNKCGTMVNWFTIHPVKWEDDEEEKPMVISKHFSSVALRIVESLGGEWYIVRIGRLAGGEKEKLRYLGEHVTTGSVPPFADDTNGKVEFTGGLGMFFEAKVCLRIRSGSSGIDGIREGLIFDRANFTLSWANDPLEPRLVMTEFMSLNNSCVQDKDWFGADEEAENDETEIEYEFCHVAMKVVSKSPSTNHFILELGRLSETEIDRLVEMAKLNGELRDEDQEAWDTTKGKIISVYHPDLGFHSAKICVFYQFDDLKVGDVFDVADITLYAEEGVRRMSLTKYKEKEPSTYEISKKDWFSKVKTEEEAVDSSDESEATYVHLGNVAFRTVKELDTNDDGRYIIAEIGRLTDDEVKMLQDIFKDSIPCGIKDGKDDTDGKVLVEKAEFLPDSPLFTARVCLYISESRLIDRLHKASSFNEIRNLTIKMGLGYIRPVLAGLDEYSGGCKPYNPTSKNWWEKYDAEKGPLTIKLNNVYLKSCTHSLAERSTVVLGLLTCSNFTEAKRGIETAILSRKIQDEAKWDDYGKELAIKTDPNTASALCRISDQSGANLTLVFDEHNHLWRVTINGVMGGYRVGGRCAGKTAALNGFLNSKYGICVPGADFDGDALAYCRADVMTQEPLWRATKKAEEERTMKKFGVPKIKQVIFDDPATVVLWDDGTKTVVHARDEEFDEEKGLAMAIARKALGNDREYYTYMQRHIDKGMKAAKKREEKNGTKKSAASAPAKKKSSKKPQGGKK